MKLTKSMREKTIRKLINHAFEDRVMDWIGESKEFAEQVYRDVYDKNLKLMQELPAGWLPLRKSIKVQFAETFTWIYFGGGLDSGLGIPTELSRARGKLELESKIIPYAHIHDAAKVFSATDQLSKRFQVLVDQRDDLIKEIRKAEDDAWAVLNSCSTMKKLLDAWPEIEPFVLEASAKSNLPDIPRSTLNSEFKLPVGEKTS